MGVLEQGWVLLFQCCRVNTLRPPSSQLCSTRRHDNGRGLELAEHGPNAILLVAAAKSLQPETVVLAFDFSKHRLAFDARNSLSPHNPPGHDCFFWMAGTSCEHWPLLLLKRNQSELRLRWESLSW